MTLTSTQSPFPIQLAHLDAGYDNVLIRDVNVKFGREKITCILGPSGKGKSTLLRHTLMLNHPLGGQVLVDGVDLVTAPDQAIRDFRRRVGVLFQGAALFNSLTLAENVAFPILERGGVSESLALDIARQKLSLVGLDDFARYRPASVSGGMKKRAGIARAMALDPEFLFLDEPSAGLDPVTAADLDVLIKDVRDRFGTTIVVVTHELASLHTIADDIVMRGDGQILAHGTLQEVASNPHPDIRAFFTRQPSVTTAATGTFSGRLEARAPKDRITS